MPGARPSKIKDIRLSVAIAAKSDRAYRALISARELCVWWVDRAETDARNQGRLRLVWLMPQRKKSLEATGVFVDLEPAQKVAWIWDERTRPKGLPALISFFIEEEGKGCRVTIIHAGFSRRRLYEMYREKWEDALAKLKLYLESGRTCKDQSLTLSDVEILKETSAR